MKENWRNRELKIRNSNIETRLKFQRGRQLINSKFQISNFVLQQAVLLILLLSACSRQQRVLEQDTYTCSMHPAIERDKPGTCPICGMELVRQGRPGEEVKITEEIARLIQSPNEKVVASVKTLKGEFRSMPVSLEAAGIVTYDTRNIYTIPARVGGRLEKVFLKYAFQKVSKGQKVAEMYSPELITAQRQLLYLMDSDPGNKDIIELSKNKLYLLGATQNQVDEVIKHKEVTHTIPIYSPYDGYVIKEDQQTQVVPAFSAATSSPMSGGMGGSATGASPAPPAGMNTSSPLLMREGNYVSTGQTLFRIVSTSTLRIELDLPAAQAGHLNSGDKVDLDLGNQKTVNGKVDLVQPFFTDGEEFVKAILYIKHGSELRIGQLVRATIQLKPIEALWVPREAVFDLGLNNIVFVKERDVFKPKNVKTGIRSDGWVEIKQGLSSPDEIASNAQYLVDSESFIKTRR